MLINIQQMHFGEKVIFINIIGDCLRMLMDFNNALIYYEKVLKLYPRQYVSLSGKGK